MKKNVTQLLGLGIVGITTLTLAIQASPIIHFAFGEEVDPYVLTLNDGKTPTVSGGNGTLVTGYSTYNYTNATNLSGYHVALDTNGTIVKEEASAGLESVNVVFEGSLIFECDYAKEFNEEHIAAPLVSGTSVNIAGNYWKITATEYTKIKSITLHYNCRELEVDPGTTTSRIESIKNVNGFADLVQDKTTGKQYFTIRGVYDIDKGRLTAGDLVIKSDNGLYPVTCDHIDILSSDEFVAYFDLATMSYLSLTGQNVVHNYRVHLFVRDTAWEDWNGETKGDVCVKDGRAIDETVYSTPYTSAVLSNYTIGSGTHKGWKLASVAIHDCKSNSYRFDPNDAADPSVKENSHNPFATVNGGSMKKTNGTTDAGYVVGSHLYYHYETDNNGTAAYNAKVTLNSAEAVPANIKIIAAYRYTYVFSPDRSAGEGNYHAYVSNFSVNGDSNKVELSSNVYRGQVSGGSGNALAWRANQVCSIATVMLNEGSNELNFTIQNSGKSTNGVMNIVGIVVDAPVAIALGGSNTETQKNYLFDLNKAPLSVDNTSPFYNSIFNAATYNSVGNPFNSRNGGTNNATNFALEAGTYRYGNCSSGTGVTKQVKLKASEATTVTFAILGSLRAGNTICATDNTGGVYVSSFTLNGEATGVTLSTKSYTSPGGWHMYFTYELATIQLNEGVNTLLFTIQNGSGANNTGNNLNIAGILVTSSAGITLGE